LDRSLKFSAHVARATNNAHQILGLIRRTFTYIDQMSMKQLYYTRTSPTTLGIRQCCVASLPKARYTIIGKVTTQSNKNDFEITAPVLRRQTENFGSAISVISQTSGRCHKNLQVYLHNIFCGQFYIDPTLSTNRWCGHPWSQFETSEKRL